MVSLHVSCYTYNDNTPPTQTSQYTWLCYGAGQLVDIFAGSRHLISIVLVKCYGHAWPALINKSGWKFHFLLRIVPGRIYHIMSRNVTQYPVTAFTLVLLDLISLSYKLYCYHASLNTDYPLNINAPEGW